MPLPTLSADKANHAIYGCAAYLVGGFAGSLAGVNAGFCGLGLAVAVGVGKELADWLLNLKAKRAGVLAPHTVDPLDAAATVAGGMACFAAGLL